MQIWQHHPHQLLPLLSRFSRLMNGESRKAAYAAYVATANKGPTHTFTISANIASLMKQGTAILDSGANRHIFSDFSLFTSFTLFKDPIEIGLAGAGPEGSSLSIQALGEGTVQLLTPDSSNPLILSSALFAPHANGNLISTSWLQSNFGMETYGQDDFLSVMKDGETVLTGASNMEKLYEVQILNPSNPNIVSFFSGVHQVADAATWHERFGHLNFADVR